MVNSCSMTSKCFLTTEYTRPNPISLRVAATNKLVRSGSWTDVFTHDFWGTHILSPLSHKSYRPLTTLTFRAEYLIGTGPIGGLTL